MPKFQDLSGQKFGRLLVIKRVEDYVAPCGYHTPQWLCKCECGNYTTVQSKNLKSGATTSCGCVQKEKITKHKLVHTRLYHIWSDMKARCYKPNRKQYKDYGGRGITVCKEWIDDFKCFYDWAMDNGYDEKAKRGESTIDRIDVNGNYEPSNCRWTDMKIQCRNKRNNRIITINGESHCLMEWCEILNLNYNTIERRINIYHWSIETALNIR